MIYGHYTNIINNEKNIIKIYKKIRIKYRILNKSLLKKFKNHNKIIKIKEGLR